MSNLYTQSATIELCIAVGFAADKGARIAAAIAMCESPGPTVNGEPTTDFAAIGDQALANDVWGFSYGAWQVRSLRAQTGTGGFRDADRLLTPRFNARAARSIKVSSGWGAWSTYTSGMYKAYLPDLFPPPPNTYVVLAGDTLSTIAAGYPGMAWQELARVNGLHEPYRITIGQLLTLP